MDISEQYEQYFTQLVKESKRILGNVGTIQDAENIVQDVFVYCLKSEKEFHFRYLRKSVANNSIKFRRKRIDRLRPLPDSEEFGEEEPVTYLGNDPKSGEEILNQFLWERPNIKKRLQEVPPSHLQVLILYLEGYSYDEIAQKMEIIEGTVGSIISRIKTLLGGRGQ